jgi:predicted HTH transcriptional regulator
VIHVVTAATTAEGKDNMNTEIEDGTGTAKSGAPGDPSKAHKKASPTPQRSHVAKKGKPTKRAKSARKSQKKSHTTKSARTGRKTKKILDLLKRPGGVTAKQLMQVTGWQPHSLRGFLSGIVNKKMGLRVTSTRGDTGDRTYSVRA